MHQRYVLTCLACVSLACTVCGCVKPLSIDERLASGDPRLRADAAHELGAAAYPEAEVRLIHLLADEDEGVRFFAAAALHRRTGERFGYLPQGDLGGRAAAVRRWVDWYIDGHPGTEDKFRDLNPWFDALGVKPSQPEVRQDNDNEG